MRVNQRTGEVIQRVKEETDGVMQRSGNSLVGSNRGQVKVNQASCSCNGQSRDRWGHEKVS